MRKFKDIPVGELYRMIQQHEENKKWRKKHKEKNQLTIDSIIRKHALSMDLTDVMGLPSRKRGRPSKERLQLEAEYNAKHPKITATEIILRQNIKAGNK